MRTILAIFLTLLTVLPHPVLLAAMVHRDPACGSGKNECSCCPKGDCQCSLHETGGIPVVPQPAVPLKGTDVYPVAAMPPLQVFSFFPSPVVPGRGLPPRPLATAVREPAHVPLFVRHRAFLL